MKETIDYINREDTIEAIKRQIENHPISYMDKMWNAALSCAIDQVKAIPSSDVINLDEGIKIGAVEELRKMYLDSEMDNINLTGWLTKEHTKHLWIPCSERLPEHSGDYLVYSVGGNWKQLSAVEIGFWDDKRFIVQSLFDVTHWMPLPKAPEKESES